VRDDGGEILVQFESNLIEEGPEKGFRSILIDVTERQMAEEALRRSNAELQQFAYVASHDLQEPLRMVTAYAGLLKKRHGEELSGETKEYMHYIIEGAERMRQLVNDLLQYSRVDTPSKPFGLVDMNVAVANALKTMRVAVEESGAEVTSDPLPTIWGDETQMTQVLTNLLSNAIKFHRDDEPKVHISSKNKSNEWLFSIQDNGIGIDLKYSDKMFQMFQRLHTQEEYPGTGIGLAISKKIVERHGGRIWFDSDGKNGSTFFFTIPVRNSEKRERGI
jgi:light-regulated signal transduction histidine kinase (bacteriophytochrome)